MPTATHQYLAEVFARSPGLDGTLNGVRRIIQGKHGSRSSLFFSAKNRAFMPVESRLERSVCYQLEADRSVAKYRTQPIAVKYGSGQLVPDICVLSVSGEYRILEVKPAVFTMTPDNLRKADFLRNHFSELGIGYSVIGDGYCGTPTELSNIQRLYNRGGRFPLESELLHGLGPRVLQNSGPITMMEAGLRIRDAGIAHYYLEAALFHGHLRCNMRLAISSKTIVERAQ